MAGQTNWPMYESKSSLSQKEVKDAYPDTCRFALTLFESLAFPITQNGPPLPFRKKSQAWKLQTTLVLNSLAINCPQFVKKVACFYSFSINCSNNPLIDMRVTSGYFCFNGEIFSSKNVVNSRSNSSRVCLGIFVCSLEYSLRIFRILALSSSE